MFYVLAAYYARGRFLSAVRQSAPSGTSHRGVPRPGLRLLVTGSIRYTVKIASAVPRRRRKSKTVHAQRPDQIPPRAFHASPVVPARPVIPAQAGTQRKTKHADSPRRTVQWGPSDRSERSDASGGCPGLNPFPRSQRMPPPISQHAREQQWFRNRLHVRVSRRPTASGLNCAQIDKQ